jgi:hypothetical protein
MARREHGSYDGTEEYHVQPNRIRMGQTAHPGEFRHIEADQAAQPPMLDQQPL